MWPAKPPRIGVFVCNCGINISSVVDVKEMLPSTRPPYQTWFSPTDNLFTCSQDTQEKIKKVMEEEKLNRVVVAACSPRTHEPLFQETMRGLRLKQISLRDG